MLSTVTVTVKVKALPEQAKGIEEEIAMCLEKFGDLEAVRVEVKAPVVWQTSLFGNCGKEGGR